MSASAQIYYPTDLTDSQWGVDRTAATGVVTASNVDKKQQNENCGKRSLKLTNKTSYFIRTSMRLIKVSFRPLNTISFPNKLEKNSIERLNGTLRQRISRLVRATLSFSKKFTHHIGAIHYFLRHYNLTLAAKFEG